MAVNNYISAKVILADFFRDINPQDSEWIYNAIEWISFGLGELGGSFHTKLTSKTVSVTNHIIKLPCGLKAIREIIYNGAVLPKLNVINTTEFDITNGAFWNEMNPTYITTSFETGDIVIYYYELDTHYDEQLRVNLPLIPDDGTMQVRIFLQEYILMKYLGKGGKHSVREFAEVRTGVYAPYGYLAKAQNAVKFPNLPDMEMLKGCLSGLKLELKKAEHDWFNSEGKSNTEDGYSDTDSVTATGVYVNGSGYLTEVE